jgi:hypothetical protein
MWTQEVSGGWFSFSLWSQTQIGCELESGFLLTDQSELEPKVGFLVGVRGRAIWQDAAESGWLQGDRGGGRRIRSMNGRSCSRKEMCWLERGVWASFAVSFILSFDSVPTSSLIGLGLCGGGNKVASLMQLAYEWNDVGDDDVGKMMMSAMAMRRRRRGITSGMMVFRRPFEVSGEIVQKESSSLKDWHYMAMALQ